MASLDDQILWPPEPNIASRFLSCRKVSIIRTKCHRSYASLNTCDFAPPGNLPQLNVPTDSSEIVTIGAEGDVCYITFMGYASHFVASGDLPQSQHMIRSSRGEELFIRTEGSR